MTMTDAEMLEKIEAIAKWDDEERRKDQWSSHPIPDYERYGLDKVIESLRVRVEAENRYPVPPCREGKVHRFHTYLFCVNCGLETPAHIEDKDHA
jgi:hypothetical protein